VTEQQVEEWVAGYERAWRTVGTGPLGDLFAEEATYRMSPYEEPWVGLAAIAEMWEAERKGPDEIFSMASEIVALDGETAVVRVEVGYGDPVDREYRDLWVVRFGADGRAVAFEEWPFWPGQGRAAPVAPGGGAVRHAILYDRDCGFCRWSLGVVLRWDRGRRLWPVALQEPPAGRLLAGMPEEERMASWHLVAPGGEVASAGAAFAPLLRLLPGGGPLAALAHRFPGAAESGYRWVAGRRGVLGRMVPRRTAERADARIAERVDASRG
jgi:predicted DCC family thiol-disulfide oxidoreductase YuxK